MKFLYIDLQDGVTPKWIAFVPNFINGNELPIAQIISKYIQILNQIWVGNHARVFQSNMALLKSRLREVIWVVRLSWDQPDGRQGRAAVIIGNRTNRVGDNRRNCITSWFGTLERSLNQQAIAPGAIYSRILPLFRTRKLPPDLMVWRTLIYTVITTENHQ